MNRRCLVALGAIVLAGVTLLLTLAYRLINSDISDSIGYVQASHQLARGEGLAFVDPHNEIAGRYYTLYAFKVVRPEDRNRYFGLLPGVPLLAAFAERLTGNPAAVHAVVPIAAALLIAVTFVLGALVADVWGGIWSAAALFAAPTFLNFSTAFWSEVPSAAVLYLGCVLCVIALRRERDDARAAGLSVLGGLAIGVTLFMRFSNASVLLALPILIWGHGGLSAFRQRRAYCMVGILLIALVGLLAFNAAYYGGPLITSYSPLHGWYDQPAFSLAYAFGDSFVGGHSVPAMASTMVSDFGWLLAFACVGLIIKPHWVGGWWLGLAAGLLAPYAVYAFAPDGINARFVIPALPALCLLAGRGIVAVGNRLPGQVWRWTLGSVLAIGMLYRLPANLAALTARNQTAQATIDRAQNLIAPTEPNAVILSYMFNDLIAVYGHRSVLNYRHMPPYDPASGTYQYSQFENLLAAEVSRLLDQGTPVYYVIDSTPPLYRSDEILRRHFELRPVSEGEPLYRIDRKPG